MYNRNQTFYYLFIQFLRAEILNYRNYIWNGCNAGLKVANVSARHANVEALDNDRQALE